MICSACHGDHGWWIDMVTGRRIARKAAEAVAYVRWHECPDCIGGVSSCCDAAGSAQPEPPEEPQP